MGSDDQRTCRINALDAGLAIAVLLHSSCDGWD
jgi:hypothetical protein